MAERRGAVWFGLCGLRGGEEGMLGQIHATCTLLVLTSLERVMIDTQSYQQACGPRLSHTQAQHTHTHTDNGHGLWEPAVQGRQGHVRPICPLLHATTVLIHRISGSLLRLWSVMFWPCRQLIKIRQADELSSFRWHELACLYQHESRFNKEINTIIESDAYEYYSTGQHTIFIYCTIIE